MAFLQLLSQVLNKRKKCALLPSKPRWLPRSPHSAAEGPRCGDGLLVAQRHHYRHRVAHWLPPHIFGDSFKHRKAALWI